MPHTERRINRAPFDQAPLYIGRERRNSPNPERFAALQEAKTVAREKYAWPGGYPLYLVTSDGGALCPACVRAEWRNIVSSAIDGRTSSGWHPAGVDIAECEESDLVCDHCGTIIAESYNEES